MTLHDLFTLLNLPIEHWGMTWLNYIIDTSRNKYRGTIHKIYKWIHSGVTNTSTWSWLGPLVILQGYYGLMALLTALYWGFNLGVGVRAPLRVDHWVTWIHILFMCSGGLCISCEIRLPSQPLRTPSWPFSQWVLALPGLISLEEVILCTRLFHAL